VFAGVVTRPVKTSRRRLLAGFAVATATSRFVLARQPVTAAGVFGAIGDGRTDSTEMLNTAARAVPEGGGVLVVPPGRYRVTGPIFLKSGTVLTGPGATIVGIDDEWQPAAVTRALVTNVGRAAKALCDHDITVCEIAFEYIGAQFGDAHAVEFRKSRGIAVESCTFSGGGNATALLACQDTKVIRCVSEGTLNCAFDHWEGSSDCIVHDCVATCARSYGILFTGVGTAPDDHEHAMRVSAINNRIDSPSEAGI